MYNKLGLGSLKNFIQTIYKQILKTENFIQTVQFNINLINIEKI